MQIPRIMIAGTHSGSGKTTIATGIMAMMAKSGLMVQPYKVGPDYIDPTYHSAATGMKSRNLDSWMLGEKVVAELFYRSAQKADISIVEGVMGLFDGYGGNSDIGSSAHIAKLLKIPVILIIDVKSMARSAAAIALGFSQLDPQVNIAGIILNRVGSQKHFAMVKEAIENHCPIPVIGYVPKNAEITLPERHLGLVPTNEGNHLKNRLGEIARTLSEGIDLEVLKNIASKAEALNEPDKVIFPTEKYSPVKIGLALDEAFSFYYQDSLELWEAYGAEFVPFSPLKDGKLPEDIKGIYIGGGFPEMYIYQLAKNQAMMDSIRMASQKGMPIYAECGGLMYLTKAIVDFKGMEHPLVGLLPAKCIMENKLEGMGYVEVEALTDNVISPRGEKFRGHEFHYSRLETETEAYPWAYRLSKSMGQKKYNEGFARDNILASYVHVHSAANPVLTGRFLDNCRKYRNGGLV